MNIPGLLPPPPFAALPLAGCWAANRLQKSPPSHYAIRCRHISVMTKVNAQEEGRGDLANPRPSYMPLTATNFGERAAGALSALTNQNVISPGSKETV